MKNLSIVSHIAAIAAVTVSMVAAPVVAQAQRSRGLDREIDRRQDKKNEWRNIAIAAGGLSVLGLLQKDRTLFFGGAAGALYSLHRYEQDRKSQSRLERARASFFGRDSFYRDGARYNRESIERDGQRYYFFRRGDDNQSWRDDDRWDGNGRDNRGDWRDGDHWRGDDSGWSRGRERGWDRDRDRDRKHDRDRDHGRSKGKSKSKSRGKRG